MDKEVIEKAFVWALEHLRVLVWMRHDLPDGMWEDVKERISPYFRKYGRDVSKWSDEVKYDFTEEMCSILEDWGFSGYDFNEHGGEA